MNSDTKRLQNIAEICHAILACPRQGLFAAQTLVEAVSSIWQVGIWKNESIWEIPNFAGMEHDFNVL